MIPKFRAWDNVNKKIVDVVNIDYQVKIIETYSNHSKNTDYFGFSEVELLQSTGIKDNNYVEIYEGDIVVFVGSNRRTVVKFGMYDREEDFGRLSKNVGFYLECNYGDEIVNEELNNLSSLVVIGNKYENPELLEVALRKCIE